MHLLSFVIYTIPDVKLLSRRVMKAQLDNCKDLLRKKKNAPHTALDIWRSQKRLRKEKVFDDPLLTGRFSLLFTAYLRNYYY